MTSQGTLDVRFDFKSETPPGHDADAASPTLRHYHRILWSKPLRSGGALELFAPASRREGYLINTSSGGPRIHFGSDAITHSYSTWTRPSELARAVASLDEDQRKKYLFPPYTIGSAMIWPVRFADKPTLNQARGTRHQIADRIDLTLECIRRHYIGRTDSPLADVLSAYGDFFAIYEDFAEFVEFFHFQDLVVNDGEAIRFFLPFEDFSRNGAPKSIDEYVAYREATLRFISARQDRIQAWATQNLGHK